MVEKRKQEEEGRTRKLEKKGEREDEEGKEGKGRKGRRGSQRKKEGEKCCDLHGILGCQTTADSVFVIKIERCFNMELR